MREVRYTLESSSYSPLRLSTDPKGWDEDSRSLERSFSKSAAGILQEFVTDIEFTGDGLEYIDKVERTEGFEANIICRREILNSADEWELDYEGRIDLLNKKRTRLGVQVSIVNGGLDEDLKNSFSEKYELSRLTDVDDNTIDALDYDKVLINGREILITTLLEDTEVLNIQGLRDVVSGGASDNVEAYYVPKLNKTYSGDPDVNSVFPFPLKPFQTASQFRPALTSTHHFLDTASLAGTKNIDIKVDATIQMPNSGVNNFYIILYTNKFNPINGNYEYVNAQTLKTVADAGLNTVIDETYSITTNLEEDESLSLVFYFQATTQSGSSLLWEIDQREVRIDMNETINFQSTTSNGLTVKKALERLSIINLGGNKIKTDFFTSGYFKDLLITNGKQIRGFSDSVETSFKELLESCSTVCNTYYGIETIKRVERIVVEPLNYFFSREVLMDIGKVNDVQTVYDASLIDSTIDIGYKKGGDYEERQGLDEYNTKSSFSHNLKKVDKKRDALSDFRADTFGIEITRRKQITDFPTEDTQFDKDNFFIDCYKNNDLYINRPYDMDFAVLPTGVFSPQTAYNLRITPKNNLHRLSNSISSIATYRNKKTIFQTGERNTELTTRLIDGTDRKENEDVINSAFAKALFQPIEYTFSKKLTPEQYNLLIGTTEGIPNYYKLIQFTDDENQTQYGYLMSYEPKDEGTFTLLKANI
jgi:hypothetical protein